MLIFFFTLCPLGSGQSGSAQRTIVKSNIPKGDILGGSFCAGAHFSAVRWDFADVNACLELGNGACRRRSLRYRLLDANFEIFCLSFLLSARRKRLSDWISAWLCCDSRFEVEVGDFGGRRIGEKIEAVV